LLVPVSVSFLSEMIGQICFSYSQYINVLLHGGTQTGKSHPSRPSEQVLKLQLLRNIDKKCCVFNGRNMYLSDL